MIEEVEERNSKLKDRSVEIIVREAEREKSNGLERGNHHEKQ